GAGAEAQAAMLSAADAARNSLDRCMSVSLAAGQPSPAGQWARWRPGRGGPTGRPRDLWRVDFQGVRDCPSRPPGWRMKRQWLMTSKSPNFSSVDKRKD